MARKRGGSGGLSRRTALALIGGGGLLGISSTGAFDQVRGQRPFDLSVNDDNALLGITVLSPIEISNSPATVDILELQNRFPDADLTEISVSSDSAVLSVEDLANVSLQPGESQTVRGDVSMSESGSETISLTVAADTGTERIEATRSITINADIPSVTDCVGPRHVITSQVNGDVDDDQGTVELAANVQVKGSVDAVGCVILGKNAQIKKSVDADGKVLLGENAQIKQSAAGSDVGLGKNAQIKGSVDATGNVSLEKNAQIQSSAAGKDFVLRKNAQIKGAVDAAGSVTLSENAQIQSTADGKNFLLEKNAKIKGAVDAAGNVTVRQNAQIESSAAGNTFILEKNAQIKGSVTATGDVILGNNAQVDGSVTADGNITIGKNAQIKGTMTAGGTITQA